VPVQLWRQTFSTVAFANARERWTARDSVLLQLTCPTTGVRGVGEACPLPGFSTESSDEAERALRSLSHLNVEFAAQPVACTLGELSARFPDLPRAARFCLESAVLDGVSRARQHTIERVIAELVGDDSQAGLPTTEPTRPATVLDVYADDFLDQALLSIRAGGAVFKVKVGRKLAFETKQLCTLQSHLDARKITFTLRLDANRSLTQSQLRSAVESWRSLPVEYLEEPCSPHVLATLDPGVVLGVPMAFDESLTLGPSFLAPWLPQVNALVCKPMYLGGVMAVLEWAKVARSRGLALVVSHLLDSPISMRVYQAMAKVLAPAVVSGLGVHPGLEMWRESLVPRASAFGSGFDIADSARRFRTL
jgi:o-succinylbenzoate synthase